MEFNLEISLNVYGQVKDPCEHAHNMPESIQNRNDAKFRSIVFILNRFRWVVACLQGHGHSALQHLCSLYRILTLNARIHSVFWHCWYFYHYDFSSVNPKLWLHNKGLLLQWGKGGKRRWWLPWKLIMWSICGVNPAQPFPSILTHWNLITYATLHVL